MIDTPYVVDVSPHHFLHQRTLARVITKIRESLDLKTILQTTTAEVRQLLDVDRVGVVQLDALTGWDSGEFVAESVLPKFDAALAKRVHDHCFGRDYAEAYAKGRIHAMEDVMAAKISPCHREILAQFQVKANLLVPLHCGVELWGLLCIHQCSGPRQWQPQEVAFVAQIADHLSIGIQQAQLLETTRQQSAELSQTLENLRQVQLQLIQAEKMSTLGELAAGVAHEINNPITFILGNITHIHSHVKQLTSMMQLYEKYCPSGITEVETARAELDLPFLLNDLPKILGSLQDGAQRIDQVVQTLQKFTRLDEAGFKPTQINKGLDDIIAMMQHRLQAQHRHPLIRLVKHYDTLPMIQGLPAALNQAFMYVLINALDAFDGQFQRSMGHEPSRSTDPPTLHIQTQACDRHIIVTIANNGPTIPPEIIPRLFEPFFTTKSVGQGTGMGLAMSRHIVGFHDGCIRYCPGEAGLTTFQIELPITQVAQ